MFSDKRPRRFHLYNVGIAKTGTSSMAALFSRYHSGHEFMFRETVSQIMAWQDGRLSDTGFESYVLQRNQHGRLEMDAASFNHHYLHILRDRFPQAKFIFTIRDCFSWLDSILNMSLRYGTNLPAWMLTYSRLFLGYEIGRATVASPQNMLSELPQMVDGLLAYWATSNQRILNLLPEKRSLVLPTHKISESLSTVARFAGIPPYTLMVAKKHVNCAPAKFNWLSHVDRHVLAERCHLHCGRLMAQFFPGKAADAFLAASV